MIFFLVYSTDYLAWPNKKSTVISPQKFRVGYRFGFFSWYSVGISWFLPNRYRRKTRSVHFGITILAGTPFFLKRGVTAPFFRGPAPILRKKGFPPKPLRVPAKFFSAQNTDQNTNQPAPIWYINTDTGQAGSGAFLKSQRHKYLCPDTVNICLFNLKITLFYVFWT